MDIQGAAQRLSFSVPHPVLRGAKKILRYPRYFHGVLRARQAYAQHGHGSAQKYIFVAGLPKSGTSWVESMLSYYPGYTLVSHPEITVFDYDNNGSHGFELPEDFFSRLGDALCVIKIHCHGSINNARILRESGVSYAVMYRDLRDAAVSHICYVQRTPWHPEYPTYSKLDMSTALVHFSKTLLPEWSVWIESWKENRDPRCSLELTYESLLDDTVARMKDLATLYGLPEDPLDHIVDQNTFQQMSGKGSFFRKGRAGDWVNHFDDRARDAFKAQIGDALIRWGYESGTNW